MNRFSPGPLLLAVGLTALLSLSGCSTPGAPPSDSTSQPETSNAEDLQETQTIQGILNQVDPDLEYLILIADDACQRFDFSGTELDISELSPGDSVTVTYTETLDPDSEEITAKLVSIAKTS